METSVQIDSIKVELREHELEVLAKTVGRLFQIPTKKGRKAARGEEHWSNF